MANGGQLSDASIEKLTAMDSKDLVDAYFKYQDTLEDGAPVEGENYLTVKSLLSSIVLVVKRSING